METYNAVKTYLNPLSDKLKIYKENRGKVGIYLFTDKETGKQYVGSSNNLSRRFSCYFSMAYDIKEQHIKNKSKICFAIRKKGIDNFKLEVLEYIDSDDNDLILAREQYYMDLINPQLNIVKVAGNTRYFKHSEETKSLISQKKRLAGIRYSIQERWKFRLASTRAFKVQVFDSLTNSYTNYNSIREAAQAIGCCAPFNFLLLKEIVGRSPYVLQELFVLTKRTVCVTLAITCQLANNGWYGVADGKRVHRVWLPTLARTLG